MGQPSRQIIDKMAREEGLSPTELSPPLYDVIDSEALDALFSKASGRDDSIEVVFQYRGREVHVTGGNGHAPDVRLAPTTASRQPNGADRDPGPST